MSFTTLVVVFILGSILAYRYTVDYYWSSGQIPPFLKFKPANEFIVYTALGASLIGANTEDSREKTSYLHYYLSRYFPEHLHHFQPTLRDCYKQPIQMKSIAIWLYKNTPDAAARIQILEFAFKFSMIDGSIRKREQVQLTTLSNYLRVSKEDYNRIFLFYMEQERKRNEQTVQQNSSTSLRDRYLKLLGLEVTASYDEVKKAYRRLAMKFHPDKMIKASKFQQNEAKENFIRIQNAYDYLEREMN